MISVGKNEVQDQNCYLWDCRENLLILSSWKISKYRGALENCKPTAFGKKMLLKLLITLPISIIWPDPSALLYPHCLLFSSYS